MLTVRYPGTEEAWALIDITSGNELLAGAEKVYRFMRIIWGDADGDGKISSKDMALAARYLAKWEMGDDFVLASADFDGDGKLTSAEGVALSRFLAKWTNLPYPIGEEKKFA